MTGPDESMVLENLKRWPGWFHVIADTSLVLVTKATKGYGGVRKTCKCITRTDSYMSQVGKASMRQNEKSHEC